MNLIYPPNKVEYPNTETKTMAFLAGSIEMGAAVDWQKEVIEKVKDLNVTILNPRRLDWDPTWKQGPNEQPFRDQVIWELLSIAKSDLVFFYFDPNTKSPISLLELGLCVGGGKKVIVCCPPTFYRYGNVKITCELTEVTVFDTLDEAVAELVAVITRRSV